MAKIRVLLVDDSWTVRRRLLEVLASDPEIEVVAEAGDGKSAIELCQRLRPDVVTMDMVLPVLSGLAATEYIMAYCPTPILIISSSWNRGETFQTYDALAAGAVDVMEKPHGDEHEGAWEQGLIAAVRRVSQIRVITHVRGRHGRPQGGVPAPRPGQPLESYRLAAIGASTGGPAAVREILRSLPPDFPLPILLVIHIGRSFAGLLADWLDGQSRFRVRPARDGEPLPELAGGQVRLAPPDQHLVVCDGYLRLRTTPPRQSCRPSVDVLFESLAESMGRQTIACLLTGMGKDGAAGLLAIRQAGGRTLAQDEASSAVFGMPAEAIARGAAEKVLALEEFAPALAALARVAREAPA